MALDPFGPSAGLDPSQPVAGLDPFAPDPNAPGPFRRGLGAGISSVKANLYGAGALGARIVGARELEKAALEKATAASEEAAPATQQLEQLDWTSPESIRQHFAWLLGNAIPSIGLMAAGGLAGRGFGALAGRTTTTVAGREAAARIGTLTGAVAPDVALEAGGIYPEALQTGVTNPALRATVGGVAAASLDFIPLLAAERYLRAAGKGGIGARLRGAAKGAPVGAVLEGGQETGQSVIERAAAGQSLTSPEAISDYINSFAGGAAPGVVLGAGIGAHRGGAARVQKTPPFTEREQPPVVNAPAPPPAPALPVPLTGPALDQRAGDIALLGSLGEQPTATGQTAIPAPTGGPYNRLEAPVALEANRARLEPLRAQEQDLVAQQTSLETELTQPEDKKRPKATITKENRALSTQIGDVRTQIGQLQAEIDAQVARQETPAGTFPKGTVTPWGTVVTRDPSAAITEPVGDISGAELALARQKQETGQLLSSREATLLRAAQKGVPARGPVQPVTERAPRERVKTVPAEHLPGLIENVATESVAKHKQGLAFRAGTETAATNALNRAVVEASKAPTIDAAEKAIHDAAITALAGRVNKADAETFAQSVAADVRAAPTFYSKGAVKSTIGPDGYAQREWVTLDPSQMSVKERHGNPEFHGIAVQVISYRSGKYTVEDQNGFRYTSRSADLSSPKAVGEVIEVPEAPAKLHRDNPGGEWLAGERANNDAAGRGAFGQPKRFGAITGTYDRYVLVPVSVLDKIPGLSGEQQNVRTEGLALLTAHMKKLGRLPRFSKESTRDYAPFVEINQDGEAWVNEGNHRIMAAKALGWKYLPTEVRYFSGGETKDSVLSPSKIAAYERQAAAEGRTRESYKSVAAVGEVPPGTIVDLGPGRTLKATTGVPIVNIGLATNDGLGVTVPEVMSALQRAGVAVEKYAVHQSDTEQTLVAQLSRPLTEAEAHSVSIVTRQESIAQMIGYQGELYGPGADKWKPFNPEYFLTLEGKRAASYAAVAPNTVSNLYINGLTYDEFLALPDEEKKKFIDGRYQVLSDAGQKIIEHLRNMVGPEVQVRLFEAKLGEAVGSYQSRAGKLKSIVQIAMNAKTPLSVADHEGFHALEDMVLTGEERLIIGRQLRPGTALFEKLIESTRNYDIENKTNITDEILSIPQEARAYGYEFWKRGELKADTALGRIFDKIKQFAERIRNYIDGLGFRSMEDIFQAIELGKYAQLEKRAGGLASFASPIEINWMADVEPDVISGLGMFSRKEGGAASQAKGRPYWVKSGADVARMRATLKKLASEGESGRDWHADSAREILAWAGGDIKKASILTSLIANFSPRTQVGQDLKKALTAYIHYTTGKKVEPGATRDQVAGAIRILTGLEADGTAAERGPGGNVSPTGIKVENFFRNLMLGIDPVHYNVSIQGATIDMWMAHAFGFANDVSGFVTKAQYNYADAEIKRLAKELGWATEEAQAAVWVGIKARLESTRSLIKKEAERRGWYEEYRVVSKTEVDEKGKPVVKIERRVKEDKHRPFVEKWLEIAFSGPVSKEAIDKANYSYADAFDDIRSGKLELKRIAEEDLPFRQEAIAQDTYTLEREPTLFSRGALDTFYSMSAAADMDRQMAAGEIPRMQEYSAAAQLINRAYEKGPDNVFKAAFGALKSEMGGDLSRWLKKNILTPNFTSRFSNGFKNVFTTLNTYDRYRSILVKTMLKEKMPQWYEASSVDQSAAFKVLLDRTVKGLSRESTELRDMMDSLTPQQKTLFISATKMLEGFLTAELESDKIVYRQLLTTPGEYEKWLLDRTTQVSEMIDKGYVPLRRYGDHTVTVIKSAVDKEGRTQDLVVARQGFNRAATAEVAGQMYKEEIARSGADLRVEVGYQYKAARDVSISVQQFVDTARRNGIPLTQLERERIVKALTTSDSMMRNRMLRREGTAGYSEDAMRVLNEFGVNMAGKMAYAKFAPAIDAASDGRQVTTDIINGTPQIQVDESMNPETGRPNSLWEQEGPQSGFHHNLADELTDYVLVPDHTGGWSRKLRAGAMMYFIGGSISGAMVNTMSVPMMTVPELSVHTNYYNAMATTLSAWKDSWQYQGILRDIVKLKDTGANPIPSIDAVPGLRQALVQASEDGRTMDTEIHQIMGMAQGTMYSQSRSVQRAIEAWMLPFRISEQTNRIASFIAAYKIGLENKLSGRDLYNFAGNIVDSTQNNYNEANRPGASRNPIYALMFMFKSFPLFMTEAALLMYKANPKSAVYMLLGLTAMTGVQGLPFAETLEDLIDTIAQHIFNSPFNSRRAMRNVVKQASEAIVGYDLSGLVLRGVINDVLGVSASSRIGAGDFVPGSRLGTADADQGKVLEAMLGAPYAMIKDTLANAPALVGAVATGDWKRATDAMRAGGPVAVRNVIKGVQQLNDGYATDAGGRKLIDVTTPEALFQLAGVSSASLAKAYEYDKIDKQTNAFYTQVRSDMQNQMVKALKDGDSAKVQDIYEAARAWNESYPEMPLMLSPGAIRRQLVLSGMQLNERTLKMLPRQLRGTSLSAEGSGTTP